MKTKKESPGHPEDKEVSRDFVAAEFAAAILAGGRSRRMGADKALLPVVWKGRQIPLWKRQLSVLEELDLSQVVLSGPQTVGSALITVADRWTDAGPLAGIATCLDFCSPEFLLVLAVDLPRMESAFLKQVLLNSREGCGVVPVRRGRFEPLAAVYPKRAFALAVARLERCELRLQDFVRELVSSGMVRPWKVPPQMEDQFTNWNSPS